MKLKNETDQAYWYRITKGEPGFPLAFKRALRIDLGKDARDHKQWETVEQILQKPWIKVHRVINNVKMYCVIPPASSQ